MQAPQASSGPRLSIPTPSPYLEHPGDPKADFREWARRFGTYLDMVDAGQTTKLTNPQRNNLLLLYLGTEGSRLFGTHPMAKLAATTAPDAFLQAAAGMFAPRRSFIRAGFEFNTRVQGPGETVEEFLAALRSILPDMDVADPSKHLTIQLVTGCRDGELRRDLLALHEPTFDRIIDIMKAREAATTDAGAITHPETKIVRPQQQRQAQKQGPSKRPPPTASTRTNKGACLTCGSTEHRRAACPHLEKTCSYCQIKGHLQSVCRKKKAGQPAKTAGLVAVTGQDSSSNDYCLNHVTKDTGQRKEDLPSLKAIGASDPIPAPILVSNGKEWISLTLEADSGATPTTITHALYTHHLKNLPLLRSPTTLRNYDGSIIKGVLGAIDTKVAYGGRLHRGEILVTKDDFPAILGKNFMGPLKIIVSPAEGCIRSIAPTKPLASFPTLTSDSMGKFLGYQHRIKLQPGAIPKSTGLRPIPLIRRDAVKEEIRQMDKLGIWEPATTSLWAHPLVTVLKPGGGVRITTDLTALNTYIIPERHPLPLIKDIFLELSGATVFSKLDLRKGFFHIQLHPDSRDLTATITPLGLRRYCRLPMGMTDSSSIFQRLISQTLSSIPGVLVYIDDIIVFGRTPEEHDLALRRTLTALSNADFRIQPAKCHFRMAEIPAFGHIISATGITPDPANLKPLLEAPRPTNLKTVQAFLGLINYFQDYIEDLASIAEPLRALTRKDAPFEWTKDCELAYQTFKKMVVDGKKLKLHLFDPNLPTTVTTDASDIGVGATLTQTVNGKPQPIAFYNRTLSKPERNYAANEKEALACILACEHWEKLLLGRRFTLQTDHQALQALLSNPTSKRQSSKFCRWRERLSHFDYTVKYLPGKDNQMADALSRLWARADSFGIRGIRQDLLRTRTATDTTLQQVREKMKSGIWTKTDQKDVILRPYFVNKNNLCWEGDLLKFCNRIVPPQDIWPTILSSAHSGHPGIVRMKRILRETYWWPGMSTQAESHVQHCMACQRSAKSQPHHRIPATTIPRAQEAAKQWALDITGPFWNGRYLAVAIDSFSGYPEILDTKDTTSGTIITWLKDLFAKQGLPDGILTDNGPQFVSEEFRTFLRDGDIHHYTSAVYNPRENGQVEAFNKYIKHGVQAFSSANKPWHQGILELLQAYRATPATAATTSPAELFLGRPMRREHQPNLSKPSRRTLEGRETTSPPSTNQQSPAPQRILRSVYTKGDRVLTKLPHTPKGKSPWSDPKTVEEVLGTYSFRLSDGRVWNARKMKPFRVQSPPQFETPPQPRLSPPRPFLRRSGRERKRPARYPTEGGDAVSSISGMSIS